MLHKVEFLKLSKGNFTLKTGFKTNNRFEKNVSFNYGLTEKRKQKFRISQKFQTPVVSLREKNSSTNKIRIKIGEDDQKSAWGIYEI